MSANEAELDRLEFVERVPELQRTAARHRESLSATGGYILRFPDHPAVLAYIRELAMIAWEPRGEDGSFRHLDLKTARQRYADADAEYGGRVLCRLFPEPSDDERHSALSAIIEARSVALYWRKIVTELQTIEYIQQQNRRAMGFVIPHKLERINDGLIETGRKSRGADPLPIVRSVP